MLIPAMYTPNPIRIFTSFAHWNGIFWPRNPWPHGRTKAGPAGGQSERLELRAQRSARWTATAAGRWVKWWAWRGRKFRGGHWEYFFWFQLFACMIYDVIWHMIWCIYVLTNQLRVHDWPWLVAQNSSLGSGAKTERQLGEDVTEMWVYKGRTRPWILSKAPLPVDNSLLLVPVIACQKKSWFRFNALSKGHDGSNDMKYQIWGLWIGFDWYCI